MCPQGIDHLGPLPHQQIACSMLHQSTLLLGRLRPHKSHPRPANRLADRLGVRRVVFVALDVSLHVLRRHQTNLVTELRQLTCPVVRGGTGLHANQARRQRREELHHLTATKLPPHDHLLGRIDAVDLKRVLGDIQTDCGNLHVDGSLGGSYHFHEAQVSDPTRGSESLRGVYWLHVDANAQKLEGALLN